MEIQQEVASDPVTGSIWSIRNDTAGERDAGANTDDLFSEKGFVRVQQGEIVTSNVKKKKPVQVRTMETPSGDIIATGEYLDAYCAKYPLPAIQGPLWMKKLRYEFFTVYRRLFTIVLTANIVAIVVLASRGQKTSYMMAAIGVGANILAAAFARHELLINAVISLIHFSRLSWPISIRKRLGKIYCHAGIHSGCGASAGIWYIYFTVLLAIQAVPGSPPLRIAIYITTGAQLLALIAMIGLSHPWYRSRHHDLWELSHRYLGWSVTALVWSQVFLLCATSHLPIGTALVRSPLFWMVTIVTLLLIYPWAMMRKRTFEFNQLSSHALRLEFDYRASRTGHNIRLSRSPLIENHGFATIPRGDGRTGFSVIISNAGDWTKEMITNQTKDQKIWVRGRLFLGIIEIPMLFSPLVVVATGSGIAPCMAFIQTHPQWPMRIVWSARSPVSTYGQEIIDTVLRADPNAIIIDTKETGRPDLPALMWAAFQEIKAEAILCVSTTKVCEAVSFEMEARKVPIYVPIFDS